MLTEKIAGEMAKEASEDKTCATFTFSTIRLLADMVKQGLYPNGNFSDNECNLWSLLTEVNRAPVHEKFLSHAEKSEKETCSKEIAKALEEFYISERKNAEKIYDLHEEACHEPNTYSPFNPYLKSI